MPKKRNKDNFTGFFVLKTRGMSVGKSFHPVTFKDNKQAKAYQRAYEKYLKERSKI
jgi:hypothetical protein